MIHRSIVYILVAGYFSRTGGVYCFLAVCGVIPARPVVQRVSLSSKPTMLKIMGSKSRGSTLFVFHC